MSLSKMLQEYREGLRDLPTYEELAAIASHESCADPIVERNVSLLRQRSTVGMQKYGTTLADNKLPLRAWLNHALEEALDQANYLQAAMAEIDSDERALPPLPQYFPDVTNIRADEELRAEQMREYARAALAAAPVQAQEPVALLTLGGIDGGEYGDNDLELVSSKAVEELQEQLVRGQNPVVLELYAHSAPAQPVAVSDDLDMQTIRERDYNAEMADKLAEAISKHFGIDIGEHSNMNCPWHEALEAIENATPAMWAALNMNGKVVCVNQDKSACDVERLCIKTPTTIAPLYAGASEPQ